MVYDTVAYLNISSLWFSAVHIGDQDYHSVSFSNSSDYVCYPTRLLKVVPMIFTSYLATNMVPACEASRALFKVGVFSLYSNASTH
jgi:hypothetical protein